MVNLQVKLEDDAGEKFTKLAKKIGGVSRTSFATVLLMKFIEDNEDKLE